MRFMTRLQLEKSLPLMGSYKALPEPMKKRTNAKLVLDWIRKQEGTTRNEDTPLSVVGTVARACPVRSVLSVCVFVGGEVGRIPFYAE